MTNPFDIGSVPVGRGQLFLIAGPCVIESEAHARKMAARMLAQGHDVLYYENIEGGHGGAANNEQRAHLQALENAFLWKTLGGK